MDIRRYSVMAATVVALSMPASGIAFAQTEEMPATEAPMQEMQQPAQQDFSEETLQSFAVAFLQVDEINKTYTPRLQEASSPEEQQQIQEEASQEMVTAVENADGITVQEYTSIMQAAQADPDLAQRLTQYIGDASQGAPAQ
jgi:LPS O-antigen subunit length determinant protein (WzzB/FepE family)